MWVQNSPANLTARKRTDRPRVAEHELSAGHPSSLPYRKARLPLSTPPTGCAEPLRPVTGYGLLNRTKLDGESGMTAHRPLGLSYHLDQILGSRSFRSEVTSHLVLRTIAPFFMTMMPPPVRTSSPRMKTLHADTAGMALSKQAIGAKT